MNSSLNLRDLIVINLSVSSTITVGGVAYVACNSVYITTSLFSNISEAKTAAVFYFANVTNDISIIRCNFTQVSGLGDGGAIAFVLATFVINGSNFINCASAGGNGGAFVSSSSRIGSRNLFNCTFSQNSAATNLGIDIYDSSNRASNYYNSSSVSKCVSTSVVSGGSILFAGSQVCQN
jgi:hypothetical protein